MYNINIHTYTQVVDVADAMVLATLFQVFICMHVLCMYVYVHVCMCICVWYRWHIFMV